MPSRLRIASLLRNLFRSGRVEQDLDDELRACLDILIAEKRRSGLSDREARRAALIELGGVDQIKESLRSARAGAVADQLRQDLVYAIRMFGRNRAFTVVVLATLALGIGANTAIFTVVDAVVFRPLPYKDPARLVKIWDRESRQPVDNVSWPDFEDIRAERDVFEQVAADDGMGLELTFADGSREAVSGAFVTAEWLTTLGVQPVLGRGFLPHEIGQPGRDQAVILANDYWRRRFGSDPHVLGATVLVDGVPCTIVGVLPPNVLRYGADFLKPLVAANYPRTRTHRDLDLFARLRPGVTVGQAQAALDTIARQLERQYPDTNAGRRFSVAPLGKYYASLGRHADRGLLLMLGAVGLVLLIACANVTNLLLARGIARSRECVVRAALGASRGRLVRQMLVESVLLFLVGGALGILLAHWTVGSLAAFAVAAGYVPERLAVAVDGRILVFSFFLSLAAGVLSGVAPALHASRVDPNDGLRASTPTAGGGFRRSRARRLLIVSEIAVSLVLLVGSGLMIRSVLRLQATSSGVATENLLQAVSDGGREFSTALVYWRAALERARQLPGVEFAAVTSRPPMHGARQQVFEIDVQAGTGSREQRAGDILISPDYFRAMGIPLLKGRAFTEQDDGRAPPVAIVSQSLARRYFGDADPLGRRLRMKEKLPMACCSAAGPVEGVWREIVGVVADVRQANLDEQPAATIYRPYSQIVEHDMFLMVRATSSAHAAHVAANLRPHLLAMDATGVWSDVSPMQDVVNGSESLRLRRFATTLLGTFAVLALFLAAVGIYGTMAYAVVERTREIGIRVALGATRAAVLQALLRETLRLTIAGLALGALAAYFLTRFISTLLFGISPVDPVTYLAVSLVLAGVALLASYVPARRALRVDPLIALRHE